MTCHLNHLTGIYFYSFDHELNSITLVLKGIENIVNMYHYTQNEVLAPVV